MNIAMMNAGLDRVIRLRDTTRLFRYKPYPKQREFHAAGATFRERLLMAGNQEGKTHSAAHETAYHATGLYPEDWEGHRFSRPVTIWTGSETNESSREIIQSALLGDGAAKLEDQNMGTGAIPRSTIVETTTRQAGVKDVVDQIIVRHVSGKKSRIVLKAYEQGREKWQGKKVDVVWLDEEPDMPIYSEAVTRTQAVPDGRVYMTFTPLKGMTDVVSRFLNPAPDEAHLRHVTNMTIYDALHYTDEEREKIILGYPAHERDCRARGIPLMGSGLVWPVDQNDYTIDPIPIPRHWSRICGIDFGIDHPFGAAWLAHDRDTDTVYLYDEFRRSGQTPAEHAIVLRAKDPEHFIPVAWPHDGMTRDKGNGKPLYEAYREHGVNMMRDSARYDDEVGGAQPVEPAVLDLHERMKFGRFKVFKTCSAFLEEARMYHREDGKIVAIKDDVISAVRMALMMLRYARVNVVRRPVSLVYSRPVLSSRVA